MTANGVWHHCILIFDSLFSIDMLQDQIEEQDEAIQAQLRHASDASQR